MKKTLKILVLTLVIFIAITIIGGIVIVNTIDPNDYKATIENQITQNTGRTTKIHGDIRWQLFPKLGIRVNDITIDNPNGFRTKTFARVHELSLSIKLLPLFTKHLDVSRIFLDQPVINLEIKGQDNNNWQDLAPQHTEQATPDNPLAFQLSDITIVNIEVKQGEINFIDHTTHQVLQVSEINFSSKDIASDKRFPLSITFNFASQQGENNLLAGQAKFKGNLHFDTQQWQASKKFISSTDITGDITIKPLTLGNLHIDNLTSTVNLNDGIFTLNPINTSLYGGRSSANLTIDTRPKQPKISLQQKLSGLQAGPLFKDLIGIRRFNGTTDMVFDLTTRGQTTQQITKNLQGNASFTFSDGTLEGVDIAYLTHWAVAIFTRQTPPKNPNDGTDFGTLTATATIKNGVIYNNDLHMKSSWYTINGKGHVDLNKQQVDYRLGVSLFKSDKEAEENLLQQLLGGTIPIIVRGSFDNLHAEPDIDMIVKSTAKTIIQDQAEELLDGVDMNEIGNKAKQILDSIFQ